MTGEKQLSLMLVCGEPSGDQLGGQLMASLKALTGGNITITGVGGPAMEAQGLETLFPLKDTAVMGLREVVPKIPVILRRVREVSDFALKTRPDVVVLIDSPDFTHRVARRLKSLDPTIKTVDYVPPQVWASRAYRARAMAKYFDLALALFPFEPPFFVKYGLRTEFVGHPVIEREAKMIGGDALRQRLGIAKNAPLLLVLPGSRTSEIRFLLPVFRYAVQILASKIPGLITVIPTVPHVADRVRKATTDWPAPLHILDTEDDKFAAFDAADVALAASGTVTMELALARTPMVVAYRVGGLTFALVRWMLNLKYFTLVNLLLDKPIVPEFLQHAATPNVLADELEKLFTDKGAAAAQVTAFDEAARLLGEGEEAPSIRAARALIAFAREERAV